MLKRLLETYNVVKNADDQLKRSLKQAHKDLAVLRQDTANLKKAMRHDLLQTVDLDRARQLIAQFDDIVALYKDCLATIVAKVDKAQAACGKKDLLDVSDEREALDDIATQLKLAAHCLILCLNSFD